MPGNGARSTALSLGLRFACELGGTELRMDLFQFANGEVRIDVDLGDLPVSARLLDGFDFGAGIKQVIGHGMPKQMATTQLSGLSRGGSLRGSSCRVPR